MEQEKQPTVKVLSNLREQRAKAILEKGEPEVLDEFTYLVPSQNSDKKYKVTHVDSYSCECGDFQHRCQGRGLYCKHIKAILIFEKLKNAYEMEESSINKEVELIIEKPSEHHCPYCTSDQLIRRGVRLTHAGEKQRYECKQCKKRCVLSPIPKIKGNTKLVCLAMDCYYRGLSFRDISAQFNQFYGLNISHETIRTWILRFSEVVDKYSKTIQPKIKGVWNADETLILTKRGINKKKHHQNQEFDYVWNVMDNETKFLLASECSGRCRGKKDARHAITTAYEQNGVIPYQIITDKNPSYQDGIMKTFRNWGNERKVKHTSILGKRKEVNNNAIESHHSHQKEFHKIRRGVKNVQQYQDGFKTFHNYVRKGVKDKLTPAERAGIAVKGNSWETMLLNSLKATSS